MGSLGRRKIFPDRNREMQEGANHQKGWICGFNIDWKKKYWESCGIYNVAKTKMPEENIN